MWSWCSVKSAVSGNVEVSGASVRVQVSPIDKNHDFLDGEGAAENIERERELPFQPGV